MNQDVLLPGRAAGWEGPLRITGGLCPQTQTYADAWTPPVWLCTMAHHRDRVSPTVLNAQLYSEQDGNAHSLEPYVRWWRKYIRRASHLCWHPLCMHNAPYLGFTIAHSERLGLVSERGGAQRLARGGLGVPFRPDFRSSPNVFVGFHSSLSPLPMNAGLDTSMLISNQWRLTEDEGMALKTHWIL